MQYGVEPFQTRNGLFTPTPHVIRFSGTTARCAALENEILRAFNQLLLTKVFVLPHQMRLRV